MTKPVISVRGIGKQYMLGATVSSRILRDQIANAARTLFRRVTGSASCTPPTSRETFWALKDVGFDVEQGEVVGIIGRNGAGKTTLLKILSEITEPTLGEIHIRGRVASLLEVGTGFHPELTGRENIYLNGAILGMKRKEISKKFDDIVDFAEVGPFIDTPVKRYSSGMYVRLAFAVAAHLEPEILLVDEVLAVGDLEFQKKCLGKMKDVSRAGRTVLFVSHNMAAIEGLCSRGLVISQGNVAFDGDARRAVEIYSKGAKDVTTSDLETRTDREGHGDVRITGIDIDPSGGVRTGEPLSITIHYENVTGDMKVLDAGLSIWNAYDARLISLHTKCQPGFSNMPLEGKVSCTIEEFPLVEGEYFLNPSIWTAAGLSDYVTHAAKFTVMRSDFYGTGRFPDPTWSVMVTKHHWWLTPPP